MAARDWREPDSGIWEGREGERHYVSSKALCRVALDRALEPADDLEAEGARRERWEGERDAVRDAILERGWCAEVGAYTGAFGSDHLDASVLLLPVVGFLPADDPRMASTIMAIERELGDGGLVRRWTGARDGGFAICSFWLADCHARAGRVARAREVFEAAAGHANDVGLLAEQIDPASGELIGNFPQTLSHVGLISAAWSIDRARRGETRGDGA
jgi:GH15 family glucan-1,4-alpha-glucosidase